MFPSAPSPWIDLSTGINPIPYPVGAIAPSAWARLPEPSDRAALEAAAGTAYGAGPAAEIIAAPGTQALIQWLPRLFPARRVGVLGFTYEEHAASWRAAGAEVVAVAALADLAAFDVGIVVNPNNPDGRLFSPDQLTTTATAFARRGGMLIVDEAFMDLLGPQSSLVPRLPNGCALVLRSFGKIYGLAGLRLGFAVTGSEPGARLRAALGPWAISGPAIEIGRRALADTAWLAATVARLQEDANRLDGLLRSAGFTIHGGTPLFRLAEHADAGRWFARLCEAGILTRPFRQRPNWLRFGIPDTAAHWQRLETTLEIPG